MSADKRSVHTDALATLGTIIDETAGRDAIHVAVEPVKAGEWLHPGQDISIVEGEALHHTRSEHTGIVDPFLKHDVKPGEWFWMLLYPRTITSLRHVWSHPAFEEREAQPLTFDKAASEQWLRNFCDSADCPGYESVMKAILGEDPRAEFHGDYLHFDGRDAHGEIPPEFWLHVEIVTGKKMLQKPSYFSCSC